MGFTLMMGAFSIPWAGVEGVEEGKAARGREDFQVDGGAVLIRVLGAEVGRQTESWGELSSPTASSPACCGAPYQGSDLTAALSALMLCSQTLPGHDAREAVHSALSILSVLQNSPSRPPPTLPSFSKL